MATEAQRRATAKYQREKATVVSVRFYPSDKPLLDHLKAQKNKAGYIKRLIREDMSR